MIGVIYVPPSERLSAELQQQAGSPFAGAVDGPVTPRTAALRTRRYQRLVDGCQQPADLQPPLILFGIEGFRDIGEDDGLECENLGMKVGDIDQGCELVHEEILAIRLAYEACPDSAGEGKRA